MSMHPLKLMFAGVLGTTLSGPNARLVSKVVHHPERAALRLVLRAKRARLNPEREQACCLDFVSDRFGVDARALHDEYARSEFAAQHRERLAQLRQLESNGGQSVRLGTTIGFGCDLLYVLVRAARPQVVVDTGVLYGATSAHLLAALERNGAGTLHSIDLGVQPDEPPNDFFVPAALRHRWELIVGDSREELPGLLARLGRVDFFHHDSLHTFEHMTWEYTTVLPYLVPGGVLSSHDVLITHSLRRLFQANAFPTFCAAHRLDFGVFDNNGVALRAGRSRHAPA